MARGVNKVTIIGNLGNDPEVRYMPQGGAVANFTVATSESWTDKNTNEKREETEWHKIVVYGRLAEIVGEYLRKGSKVYLEGKLKTRKWQDKDGADKYTTEIICNEMQMLDGANSQQQKPVQQQGYQQPQQRAQQPQQHQQQGRPAPQGYQPQMGQNPNLQPFDDDINF